MPQIVLLRLGDEMQTSIFDDMYQPLCDDISQKYPIIQAKSAADVRPLLSNPSLQAILIVDRGLTKGKKHIALQKQLSSYAHARGTIIFCCIFTSTFPGNLATIAAPPSASVSRPDPFSVISEQLDWKENTA